MKILIDKYRKEIDRLDVEFSNIWQGASNPTNVEMFQQKEKTPRAPRSFNRDIISKKEKKLLIDLKAFRQSKAYRWAQRRPHRPFKKNVPNNKPNPQPQSQKRVYEGTLSDSSTSSSYASLPQRTTKQKWKRYQDDGHQKHKLPKQRGEHNSSGDTHS